MMKPGRYGGCALASGAASAALFPNRKHPSLTRQSFSGFLYFLLQNGAARIVGFAAQILLARLLSPSDFGEIALVTSLSAIMSTLIGFGIDDVVLSRARRFHYWLSAAFWLSLVFSILGALALIALAPVAARAYRSPSVFGLLAIAALALPLTALSTVPNACLRAHLRFRFLSVYAALELIALQLLTILLAARGFGPWSFVIPIPLAAAVRAFSYWRAACPPKLTRIRPSQARALLGHGLSACGQKLITSLRENGDYLLLGFVARKAEVGLYFMAFKLAAVPVYSLLASLCAVLFPTLAQLRHEPARQRAAALGASRAVALTVIPLSFLQAALAPALLRVFFPQNWLPSSTLLSVLSLGLAFDAVPCVTGALLAANGRFVAQWKWSLATLPLFFLLIAAGCKFAGALGVAFGVAIFFLITAPAYSYFGLRLAGCSWSDIAGIYLPPTVCSTAAAALALFIAQLPQVRRADMFSIAAACACMLLVYSFTVRFLAPVATRDALNRLSIALGLAV